MKVENIQSTAWLVATILLISIILSSCGTSKQCHVKGHYVFKSIKKEQNQPRRN
jgi:hypothetical protein